MKIAIVILHYETLNDTKECIESLQRQDNRDVDIIVVDNGSPAHGTGELRKQYGDDARIHFIDSEKNLGFAKGNNLGFVYAKTELGADLVILANSDLVFKDTEFISKLVKVCENETFDVAGPRIVSTVDGKNQNPVRRNLYTIGDVRKRVLKNRVLLFLNFFGMDELFRKRIAAPVTEFHPAEGEDFQLHGACMIFGKKYIDLLSGLYPGTFMYAEEDILRYMVDRYELTLRYFDELTVYHKEGSATSAVMNKNHKKRRFFLKWSTDSLQQLSKLMKTTQRN